MIARKKLSKAATLNSRLSKNVELIVSLKRGECK